MMVASSGSAHRGREAHGWRSEASRLSIRSWPDVPEEFYGQQVDRVRDLTRQVTRTHKRAVTNRVVFESHAR